MVMVMITVNYKFSERIVFTAATPKAPHRLSQTTVANNGDRFGSTVALSAPPAILNSPRESRAEIATPR